MENKENNAETNNEESVAQEDIIADDLVTEETAAKKTIAKEAATGKTAEDDIKPDSLIAAEEAGELLNNENIVEAVKSFNADTKEKEIALEFVKSHIQFIEEIVDNDKTKGISRKNIEIQDMVSHINIMLKKRDEFIFTSMVFNSPSHYRSLMGSFFQDKSDDKKKAHN